MNAPSEKIIFLLVGFLLSFSSVMTVSDFSGFFLGIIFWKEASLFSVCVCGEGGRFRWGASFLCGGVPVVGELVLMEGLLKKNQDGAYPSSHTPSTPTLWETLILSIFANIQVGKHAEYCISLNKGHPLIGAASSVTGDFLEIFSKVFRTAMLKSNHMQWVCNGYS